MKHAYKSFLLENESPVKICGDESLYALQNTSNNTVTLQGSNTATEWANLIDIPAGTTKHIQSAFAFLKANGKLYVNRTHGSLFTPSLVDKDGNAISNNNPMPVSAPDGLTVSGTVTGVLANQATSGIPTVLFTTSMLNYESITVQVTSAGSNCTITYETSDDNTNWVNSSGLNAANIGTSSISPSTSTAVITQFPRKALYFRARVSTYGSGSTVSVVGTLSKATVVQLGTVVLSGESSVRGSLPEGNAATTYPVLVGLEARTSSKTSVANASAVRPIATVDGRLVARLNSIPENEWQYAAASGGITNTSDVVLQAAAGAGIKNYLTGLSVANASATATEVVVKDGSTVIWRSYVAANLPLKNISFPTPLQSTANTALNVACITTGTQTYISAQGYKAP